MKCTYSVYIAVSKDGFIADQNNSVAFLNDLKIKGDGGYQKYYDQIDGLIYGSKTYDFIKEQAQYWPYDKKSFVLTSRIKDYKTQKLVEFLNTNIEELDQKLFTQGFKHLWVMGGANVINQYLKKNTITKMIISECNTTLKKGLKLFEDPAIIKQFKLVKTENYGDIKNLIYEKK